MHQKSFQTYFSYLVGNYINIFLMKFIFFKDYKLSLFQSCDITSHILTGQN